MSQFYYFTPSPFVSVITGYKNECGVITILPMVVECVVSNPTSFESTDGEVSVSITGGTAPYTVTWSYDNNVIISPAINGLGNGSYTATTVDYWGDYSSTTVCEIFTDKDCTFSASIEEFIPPSPTPTPTPTPTNLPLPVMCFTYYGLGYSGTTTFSCEVTAENTLYNGKNWWSLTSCPTGFNPNNPLAPCPSDTGFIWWDSGSNVWYYTPELGDDTTRYSQLYNPGELPIQIMGTYEWGNYGMGTCNPQMLNSFSGPCVPSTPTPTPTRTLTPTPTRTLTPTPTPTPTTPPFVCPECTGTEILIGTQIWEQCNSEHTTYRDGTPIPEVTNPAAWSALTTGAWCYYNNDSINGPIYGKLYNWYAVAGIYDAASLSNPLLRKQFAPTGYHVPSITEFTTLVTYLGGISVAGGAMKTTGTTFSKNGCWLSPNGGATNSSEFRGQPGGWREVNPNVIFTNINYDAIWWSSTESGTFARFLVLNSANSNAISGTGYKKRGYAVRLIKD